MRCTHVCTRVRDSNAAPSRQMRAQRAAEIYRPDVHMVYTDYTAGMALSIPKHKIKIISSPSEEWRWL